MGSYLSMSGGSSSFGTYSSGSGMGISSSTGSESALSGGANAVITTTASGLSGGSIGMGLNIVRPPLDQYPKADLNNFYYSSSNPV